MKTSENQGLLEEVEIEHWVKMGKTGVFCD